MGDTDATVEGSMHIDDVDFDLYVQTFDPMHLHSVQQFLEAFDCCPELRLALEKYLSDQQRVRRHSRRILREKRQAEIAERERQGMEAPPLPPLKGKFCPECGGQLHGAGLPNCERKKTGRETYSECADCIYYVETFASPKGRIGNRPIRKGGENHGR